ncbi:MAG: glycosyltransferase family 2 protein [Bacilli bacterium]|nr:glycosyltransferase family 2 protein [Bacilli bacterium]
MFDIPVVLFMFKRLKAVEIIKRISCVKPNKIYLMADSGRNAIEKKQVDECRKAVESAIDWPCEIIKNYAEKNRGVYKNIGEGAIWVLKREKWAIFLEDDNLPEISFFRFCKEMLEKYEDDTRIFWICGTNYLGKYNSKSNHSYVFTRHMLPCGWASWSSKFLKYYDGKLENYSSEFVQKNIDYSYYNYKVYKQYKECWKSEYIRINNDQNPISWDYQMDFTIKANNLFGICPCNNQIKNIGVDENSIHGGNDFSDIMTKRFCGMDSYPVEFPLIHPETLLIDKKFEDKISKILLYPLNRRLRNLFLNGVRSIFRIPDGVSTKQFFLKKGKKK